METHRPADFLIVHRRKAALWRLLSTPCSPSPAPRTERQRGPWVGRIPRVDSVFTASGIPPAHEPVDAVFGAIFLMASDPMVLVNDSGDFLDANPAAEALFGVEREKLLQVNLLQLGLARRWADFLRAGSQRGELSLAESDSAPARIVEYSATARLDKGRHLLILRDVTERRANERRKDEFLAMLAHELRNPLGPILAATEVMRRHHLDASMRQVGEVVERQARHLARLVDDLLDVARITRGSIELRLERIQLRQVLAQVVQAITPMVEGRRQHLVVNWPAPDLYLRGDPARLDQIFTNLLHNASKFTPDGGRLELWTTSHATEVEVVVRDFGQGIPPQMLSQVFELFVQVSPTLDRSRGGLGLGLTLVQQLVGLHGGSVTAHSEGLQRGAQFCVRLPLSSVHPASSSSGVPMPRTTVSNLRVLIAEDQPDARWMLCELLELWGNTVHTAADGQGALEAMREHRPDIALVDIGLPRVDGYEVARHIRQAEQGALHKPAFLVALTGYGQPEDRRRALEAGFNEHCVKPLEAEALRRLLAQVASGNPRPT